MTKKEHPFKGMTFPIQYKGNPEHGDSVIDGKDFRIEDYWHNISETPWQDGDRPATINYMNRQEGYLSNTDEPIYGKVGAFGFLVHPSELLIPEAMRKTAGHV